jgi:thymidine phosphorylase
MLYLGGKADKPEQGKLEAMRLLDCGSALEKFYKLIELQGGDARVVHDTSLLPRARYTAQVTAAKTGFISAMDCQSIGTACVVLGGGRNRKEDAIDPSVGMVMHRKLGDRVATDDPVCTIHYNSETQAGEAAALLRSSFTIAESAPAQMPLVRRIIQ